MSEPTLWEWVNLGASAVLIGYTFLACYVMPSRGMWPRRLLLWAVSGMLGVQMASPWAPTLPDVTWHGASLHLLMALSLLLWHDCVVRFVVTEFVAGADLESRPVPFDESPLDRVRGAYVRNRRRVLRRLRDRESQLGVEDGRGDHQ